MKVKLACTVGLTRFHQTSQPTSKDVVNTDNPKGSKSFTEGLTHPLPLLESTDVTESHFKGLKYISIPH